MPEAIRLIHWNEDEADERSGRLQALGYQVNAALPVAGTFLQELTDDPPDAIVISLERLPAQGRDFALVIRQRKSTRHLPLVFVGGEDAKIKRVREVLPDATFTTWPEVRSALKRAIEKPIKEPVVHKSALAGYAGTPLLKKLGIREGMVVGVMNAPNDLEAILGELPEGVTLRQGARGKCDLILCFNLTLKELRKRVDRLAARTDYRSVWLAWPKKTSGVESDLSEKAVRETGLNAGLVDFKICSIDDIWSGLRFTRRKG